MITRLALFITLLAVFYFYCNDETKTDQYRGPNDINMIEVPQEISPSFLENSTTNFSDLSDSVYFLSSEYSSAIKPIIDYKILSLKKY